MPFSLTYISGCQHVLRVNESSEQSHQLYCSTQLWVRVTNHLLDHYIYQQNILLKIKKILSESSQLYREIQQSFIYRTSEPTNKFLKQY